jgi:hypothetical protein
MVKKFFCHTFFCRHKFHKILNYFIFEMPKKKMWASFLFVSCKILIEDGYGNSFLFISHKIVLGLHNVPEPKTIP